VVQLFNFGLFGLHDALARKRLLWVLRELSHPPAQNRFPHLQIPCCLADSNPTLGY
jgi:hypothetical protein